MLGGLTPCEVKETLANDDDRRQEVLAHHFNGVACLQAEAKSMQKIWCQDARQIPMIMGQDQWGQQKYLEHKDSLLSI